MAKIKKAQKGAALTKVTDSIKPARPNYNGYRPPYVPSGKNQSKFDEGIESVKKLYQDGKLKQRRTGGTVKKAQVGKTIKKISDTKLKDVPAKAMNLGRKVVNRVKNSTVGDAVNVATMGAGTAAANMYKAATKKSSAKKPSLNTIVPGGGRNFYDINMSKKDRISPEMSRKGKSIKKNMLAKSGTKLKKK